MHRNRAGLHVRRACLRRPASSSWWGASPGGAGGPSPKFGHQYGGGPNDRGGNLSLEVGADEARDPGSH
jgi:hypothetical protein